MFVERGGVVVSVHVEASRDWWSRGEVLEFGRSGCRGRRGFMLANVTSAVPLGGLEYGVY